MKVETLEGMGSVAGIVCLRASEWRAAQEAFRSQPRHEPPTRRAARKPVRKPAPKRKAVAVQKRKPRRK